MKIKVSEATPLQLDYMVAYILGAGVGHGGKDRFLEIFKHQHANTTGYCFSSDWALGGPIIEREGITVIHFGDDWEDKWQARRGDGHWQGDLFGGSTPLIAAMRCYVVAKWNDAVEIPEELK